MAVLDDSWKKKYTFDGTNWIRKKTRKKKRMPPRKIPLWREIQPRVAVMMSEEPGMSKREMARLLKVDIRTVSRAVDEVRPKVAAALEQLRDRFLERAVEVAPPERVAEKYAEIMNEGDQGSVQLAAAAALAKAYGVGEREKEEVVEEKPQPMFVLPGNAQVTVNIDRRNQTAVIHEEASTQEN